MFSFAWKKDKKSATLILALFKQAAALMNKKSRWEDLSGYLADPDDDETSDIETNNDEKERMEYYLGGKHPDNYHHYYDRDLEPEDFELKEPAFRFDPKEHIEGGGSIIGKDDSPYIEDEEGKHYDIYKDDEEILNEDEGELDLLGEIHDDLPEFGLTKEDLEYIKDKDIDETNIRDREDYNACDTCGFDHSYETENANEAHDLIDKEEIKTLRKHKR